MQGLVHFRKACTATVYCQASFGQGLLLAPPLAEDAVTGWLVDLQAERLRAEIAEETR